MAYPGLQSGLNIFHSSISKASNSRWTISKEFPNPHLRVKVWVLCALYENFTNCSTNAKLLNILISWHVCAGWRQGGCWVLFWCCNDLFMFQNIYELWVLSKIPDGLRGRIKTGQRWIISQSPAHEISTGAMYQTSGAHYNAIIWYSPTLLPANFVDIYLDNLIFWVIIWKLLSVFLMHSWLYNPFNC